MTNFESVKKFMKTFGQEIKEKAGFPNDKTVSLRYNLINTLLGMPHRKFQRHLHGPYMLTTITKPCRITAV